MPCSLEWPTESRPFIISQSPWTFVASFIFTDAIVLFCKHSCLDLIVAVCGETYVCRKLCFSRSQGAQSSSITFPRASLKPFSVQEPSLCQFRDFTPLYLSNDHTKKPSAYTFTRNLSSPRNTDRTTFQGKGPPLRRIRQPPTGSVLTDYSTSESPREHTDTTGAEAMDPIALG